jgi:pyruvate ferredoxin oxidoreductase gamma subunit
MIEIKFLGSGGHGVVLAANILANAAVKSGHQSQSFASYGALRRGGMVESYVRIDDKPIILHCKVYQPNFLVLMDETFFNDLEFIAGVQEGGSVLINSERSADSFTPSMNFQIITVDCNRIAAMNGVVLPSGVPVINTTILGAVVGLLQEIGISDLLQSIKEGDIPASDKNIDAATEAYNSVKDREYSGELSETEVGEVFAISKELYPSFIHEQCNMCGICYIFCPEVAIKIENKTSLLTLDRDLCKKCGICVKECPRDAILLKGES